jgi:hypothetical protein
MHYDPILTGWAIAMAINYWIWSRRK